MTGKPQLPPRWETELDAPTSPGGGVTGASTRLDELRAMRAVMARHIDSEHTLARDLAALIRQARDVSKEIEELEALEAEAAEEAGNLDATDAPFTLETI